FPSQMRGASPENNLALFRFFERPFPAGSRKAKRASGDSVSAAPADYSGGTVADFHGLLFTREPAKFSKLSLCPTANRVNRAAKTIEQRRVVSDSSTAENVFPRWRASLRSNPQGRKVH